MAKGDASAAADVQEAKVSPLEGQESMEEIAATAVNVEIARRVEIERADNALERIVQQSEHCGDHENARFKGRICPLEYAVKR